MTPVRPTRFRPDAAIVRDLAWRVCLVILATVGVLLDVPLWARAPLSIAAAAVTVLFFLSRYRTRGPVDGALIGFGIVVVVLALLGAVLAVLPRGIGTASWGIGAGAVELIALLALTFWRAPQPTFRRWPRASLPTLAWALGIIAVLGGALAWSITSFSATHVAPLSMSAVSSGQSVVVTLSSGREDGPYLLQIVSGSERTTVARDIRIGPGNPGSITVTVPPVSREKLQLVRVGSDSAVRELIVDTTTNPTTTKVSR